jgi:superfamily I DNA/RNA helicase
LKVLSEQQQRWIFSLDPSYNYLLDVAGSGKTNVLISKALHTVDSAGNGHLPLILLTTYSANLETNIRRILQHKIADAEDRTRYLESIEVWCIPTLMEQMITAVYGLRSIEEYRTSGISPEAYEAELRKDVAEILRSEPDRFRRFDYIFVDEIQDFDNLYLQVVQHLCRTGHYFFVGDIGQKIYDRRHDLERLGFVTLKAEVAKSYKMYRTPRAIAELATRFILSDPLARSEFAERGYTESFRSQNTLWSVPEILRADLPEAEIPSRVEALLNEGITESDILIITSAARLTITESRLQSAGIRYCLTESEHGKAVTLVEFMAAKGLEKEVVIVSGIEDLFERSKPDRLFDDEGIRRQQELLSRRKIYVALTRPLQQLIVYYQDSSNRFVADLLKINSEIINRV